MPHYASCGLDRPSDRLSQFENAFLRFFQNPKNVTFYVFLKCYVKKRKKRRKPYPGFMYTNQITDIKRLQNWVLSEM